MREAMGRAWANPASVHAAGRASRALLEEARRAVAGAIGADPADVVLTGGGTEACNLGVRGLAAEPGGRWLVSAIEHPALLEAVRARAAQSAGACAMLPLATGRPPAPEALEDAITADTRLVAVGWVNHETGSVLPLGRYAEICRRRGVPLVVDATQAAGKLPIDVSSLGATAIALASHKLGGPAGAGALWVARSAPPLQPLLAGGGQERGRRPGSPDVLAAVGFGAACAALDQRLHAMARVAALRDRLEAALVELGAVVNGAEGPRCAGASNVSLRGARGDHLVAAFDLEGVCVSSGAACSSGLAEPSPVLRALYPREPWRAESALRVTFGPETRDSDVESAIEVARRVLPRVRREATPESL